MALRRERNKRFRKQGFKRTRIGYSFPGTDNEQVLKALKKKNKETIIDKDPKIRIEPIDPKGMLNITFN